MNCKICNSNQIKGLDNFIPYSDKEWSFEVLECEECSTRFVLRDNSVNYHEELHSNDDSPYIAHYSMAKNIKTLLDENLEECESILKNKSSVIAKVLKYISSKDKNISILEIGCSTGYTTAYIQKIGYTNMLGIDISSSAIDYASSTFGNFYALKEKEKKYDVIFHTGLIGCVDEPIDFLNHYLNLLTTHGVMFFNAPNVASVQETDELWVSTPPPDLIYLFEKNVFCKVLDKKYNIVVSNTLTPISILRKHINRYKNKKNNLYPRTFYKKDKKNVIPANKFFKNMVSSVVNIFVKLKILKHYSDDYGIIVKIEKHD